MRALDVNGVVHVIRVDSTYLGETQCRLSFYKVGLEGLSGRPTNAINEPMTVLSDTLVGHPVSCIGCIPEAR